MLDRTRSYGTCSGATRYAYEQDGKYFDGNGNEILEEAPENVVSLVIVETQDPPIFRSHAGSQEPRRTLKQRYERRFGAGSYGELPGTKQTKRYHAEKRLAAP